MNKVNVQIEQPNSVQERSRKVKRTVQKKRSSSKWIEQIAGILREQPDITVTAISEQLDCARGTVYAYIEQAQELVKN